jgi:monoamine oxidase
MEKVDVIVIGAGASGLMAAQILSDAKINICMLEGRDRIGGRIHTLNKPGFSKPIEAGAEFIHGKLPLTLDLLKKARIKYHTTKGSLWQYRNNELVRRNDFIEHADVLMATLKKLDEEMSIAQFLQIYFPGSQYDGMKLTLRQYIEGYDAGDINNFSALALKEEWEEESDEQYRIDGGYGVLLDHLYHATIKNGVAYYFSTIVQQINWRAGHVEVITSKKQRFLAQKVLITIPLPLLSNTYEKAISLQPELPAITNAAKQIGYGGVIKVIFEFTHPFWESIEGGQVNNLSFLFSTERIPTWWTQLPDKSARLTGWLAGPNASLLANAGEQAITDHALRSLSIIFKLDLSLLSQYLTGTHIHDWIADPFTKGGYSYVTVNSRSAVAVLRTPIASTLFFAGEALAKKSNATVEAAFESGKSSAEKILAVHSDK